jgi:hypothetical protein
VKTVLSSENRSRKSQSLEIVFIRNRNCAALGSNQNQNRANRDCRRATSQRTALAHQNAVAAILPEPVENAKTAFIRNWTSATFDCQVRKHRADQPFLSIRRILRKREARRRCARSHRPLNDDSHRSKRVSHDNNVRQQQAV